MDGLFDGLFRSNDGLLQQMMVLRWSFFKTRGWSFGWSFPRTMVFLYDGLLDGLSMVFWMVFEQNVLAMVFFS